MSLARAVIPWKLQGAKNVAFAELYFCEMVGDWVVRSGSLTGSPGVDAVSHKTCLPYGFDLIFQLQLPDLLSFPPSSPFCLPSLPGFIHISFTTMDGSMDLDIWLAEVGLSTPRFGFERNDSSPQQHNAFDAEPTSERSVPVLDPSTAAASMAPPPQRRKPKAKTLREKDWQPVKERMLDLMKTKSLSQVRTAILEECGFEAT